MILVTGSTGFVGRRLVARLDSTRFPVVRCLIRKGEINQANCTTVRGDLRDPSSYESALAGVETVVHLAALTGKAKRESDISLNTTATEKLLDACRRAGVRNFLFVSSIAAKFQHVEQYYYAQSKQAAEAAVLASGLQFTIVRPTPIIGHGGATWNGFVKLARLPLTPIFGRGTTRIQPVFVDDLAAALVSIISERRFDGEIIELGGPEIVTIKDFVLRVRKGFGLKTSRVVFLPLKATQKVLSMLEPFMLPLLPLTAGQLTSFAEEGTISETLFFRQMVGGMNNIDDMIAHSMDRQ